MGGDIILEVAVRCPDSVIGFVGVDNFKNAGTAMLAEIQNQIEQIMAMLKSDFANTSEYFARQALLSASTDLFCFSNTSYPRRSSIPVNNS